MTAFGPLDLGSRSTSARPGADEHFAERFDF
jgi:hypothetical protein